MLDKYVKQLAKELDMEDLVTTPESGHYLFPFAGKISVHFSPTSSRGILYRGMIGPYPKDNSDAFLLNVMEANLFGRGTRGTTIGFKEDENLLTLSLEVSYNIHYKEFKERLEDFVSVMNFWREEASRHL